MLCLNYNYILFERCHLLRYYHLHLQGKESAEQETRVLAGDHESAPASDIAHFIRSVGLLRGWKIGDAQ
jgi:hypothetical protein